jgi:hypothetical protein
MKMRTVRFGWKADIRHERTPRAPYITKHSQGLLPPRLNKNHDAQKRRNSGRWPTIHSRYGVVAEDDRERMKKSKGMQRCSRKQQCAYDRRKDRLH